MTAFEPVTVRVGDVVRRGSAVSVMQSVPAETLIRAVREQSGADSQVVVRAEPPGPVHEYVGYIHPQMSIRTRTALAAAGRSRGLETPHDEELAEARKARAEFEIPERPDERPNLREAVAAATRETAELRETVAAARGRLLARRKEGLDPTPAAEELADAVAQLSDVETAAAAATQRLEAERELVRKRRTARENRFRIEERIGNLERATRAHLAESVEPVYVSALEALPDVETVKQPYSVEPTARALAVARVADLAAPVVLACDRFDSPTAAVDWLDAPVIRV